MTTFAKSSGRTRWRRSRLTHDRVLLAIITFAVALAILLIAAYLRSGAGHDSLGEGATLPALSAGHGSSVMQDRPVRLGVGAPGTAAHARNAVESILSDSPVSSPAPMPAPPAFGLCNGLARGPRWTARLCQTTFPGVTVSDAGGAASHVIRESDTRAAAPGSFCSLRAHVVGTRASHPFGAAPAVRPSPRYRATSTGRSHA